MKTSFHQLYCPRTLSSRIQASKSITLKETRYCHLSFSSMHLEWCYIKTQCSSSIILWDAMVAEMSLGLLFLATSSDQENIYYKKKKMFKMLPIFTGNLKPTSVCYNFCLGFETFEVFPSNICLFQHTATSRMCRKIQPALQMSLDCNFHHP